MTLSDLQYKVVQLHIADIEREVRRSNDRDRPVARAIRQLARTVRSHRS